jgi:S1-C subfamily serine protease
MPFLRRDPGSFPTLRTSGLLASALGLGLWLGAGHPVDEVADLAAARAAAPGSVATALSEATQLASRAAGPAIVGVRRYEPSRFGGRANLTQRGSGVLVREDGVIVTNGHVIRDASEVRVALQDGRVVRAEVLGIDDDTDLAVIRIEGEGYPVASFETGRDPAVGEWVLALGNPFGLDLTVTMGIVSGTRRSDLDIARYEDFLQTDAAINPGNSGGALVDLHGRVLGINTAMGTPEEGSVGIGYATPAWFVVPVVESILTHGEVRRGFLGVSIASLDDRWTASLGYGGASRAVVSYANSGSPAAAAGLQRGDVIERLDDQPVTRRHQVYNALGFRQPGTAVRLGIWRAGEQLEVAAVLGERPPENQR